MFPARAGMSPDTTLTLRPSECAPRASGDEPTLSGVQQLTVQCSLRERG